jgi:flagellar hook-associated protein 3 FlgL
MAIPRVSDNQMYTLLNERAGRLQTSIRRLEDQLASGRRLSTPDEDPVGASRVVRGGTALAGLGQYRTTSRFGIDVLEAQDEALGEGINILVRAEEIATQQASGLVSTAERAAAREEVHGLLEALTSVGNTELAGRRLFGGLALDAPPPFADPDSVGYTAATAYTGSTHELQAKTGGGSTERVRLSTRGDTVFGGGLVALEALETALATNGNVAGTLSALATARGTIGAERASVGARQSQLVERDQQVGGLTLTEQNALANVQEADLVAVISQLTQAQTALQAVLAAGSRIAQTSLTELLRV